MGGGVAPCAGTSNDSGGNPTFNNTGAGAKFNDMMMDTTYDNVNVDTGAIQNTNQQRISNMIIDNLGNPGQMSKEELVQAALAQSQEPMICPKHNKQCELICVNCKHRICHSCALFGDCKGHDIKEPEEAVKEVVVRTEALMEMFEQMKQEQAAVQADGTFQMLFGQFNISKNYLKDQVAAKF